MHMWYWAIMVLLILGSIALLCSTFISVKKESGTGRRAEKAVQEWKA